MKITLRTPGPDGGYEFPSVQGMPSSGLSDFQSAIRWGTTVLMMVAVLVTLFFLIWGGIEWITSGGNKDKVQSAQKKIIYATIGLIITLGAFFIINLLGTFFGIEFF